MKSANYSPRATLVVTSLLLAMASAETKVSPGQTKYLEPAKPAATPAPAPESKGFFSFLGLKKRDSQPAPAETKAAVKPVAKTAVKPVSKAVEKPATKPAKAAPPVTTDPAPESKGILSWLGLKKKSTSPTPAEAKPVAKSGHKKDAAKPADLPAKAEPPQMAKTKPAAAPPAAPELKQPGFFSRLFGGKASGESQRDDDGPKPPRPVDWDKKYIVTEDNVGAYRFGPAQSRDADEYLSKGTVVTLKKGGKAWSDIALENGRIFTVGADQIRPAKASDFAAPPPPVIAAMPPPVGPNGAPLPMGYLEPIPSIDLPETQAQPKKGLEAADLILPALPPP